MDLISTLTATVDGDLVSFHYEVTNRGDSPATLTFRSGKRYDITVTHRDASEVIWQASEGQAYTMMMDSVELPPGESASFQDETQLEPGTYEATATLASTEMELPAIASFTIE